MQKLKKGDFVNYKIKADNIQIGYKIIPIEILKIPNDNYSFYDLLRLDNDEIIKTKESEFYKNYQITEIGIHHFIGLKAKWDSYDYEFKNGEKDKNGNIIPVGIGNIKFTYAIIEDLKFFQIFYIKDINYKKQVCPSGYYLLENTNLKTQDFFKYFFKEKNGEYNIKDDLEGIAHINQLFDKLDLINYDYNKKEIVLLESDSFQQTN
jgi:hypothetical protein